MHIFSAGPMCSLRRTLLFWLLPLFLVVGIASAAFSYWCYGQMVSTFLDEQMQQLADSVAVQETHTAPPPQSGERLDKWGAYVVQVYDKNAVLQVTSAPQLQTGLLQARGFQDVRYEGKLWRAYARPGGADGSRVQVFQSGDFRRHLAADRAGAALAPVLILLPLAALVLWGVAGAVSRAVQDIGRRAALQDEHTIAELPLTRVPIEIAPLVVSFNSLLARLRDAFAAQRRFVQDAAHELRTPITAVALQLENLRGDLPPGGECAQSFAQLEAGVHRAQRLVDQLLKLSRREANTQEVPVAVDLQALLHESISALIALADQRGIDLGLVAPDAPQAPVVLRCVAGDLRSVLDNLIENALRYTPEGGVVDVRVAGNAAGGLLVEVVDTGPGIPADQIDRVFDRFYRVAGNGSRGSGLGLAIAQASARRCGLQVSLRNREDRSGLIARIETAA